MTVKALGSNLHQTHASGIKKRQPFKQPKLPFETITQMGRERAWISSDKQGQSDSIHGAVSENNLEALTRFIESGVPNIINLTDDEGNTPLHIAAQKGNIKIVEFLIENGGDIWALNSLGLSPVFEAADGEHGAIVNILLNAMDKEPRFEGRWYTEERAHEAITNNLMKPGTAKSGRSRESKVDKFVHKIAGTSIKDMNQRSELYKYISHLNSWTGSTLGEEDEGWYFDRVLIQRIRSMANILLNSTPIPPELLDNRSLDEGRAILVKELAIMLNTLRSARRMATLQGTRMGAPATRLNQHEARQTLNRIVKMKPGDAYTFPIGFPGHAIYMGIEKKADELGKESLVFHINNLGAGFPKTHEGPSRLRVLPKGFSVPLWGEHPELMPRLSQLIEDIFSCRSLERTADWQTLYGAISTFEAEIKRMFGPKATIVDAEEQRWQSMKAQSAGNCALKNHSASMSTRLGKPLFKWFKSQEKAYVRSRSENLVDNKYFNEKEFEKDAKILSSFLDNRRTLKDELVDFLNKPRPRGIASEVTTQTLAELMEEEWDISIMKKLISLKADFKGKDKEDNTLLHCAAKLGQWQVAQLLIDKGINVNSQNSRGKTALHYAMEQQNLPLTQLLLRNKANPDLTDNEGNTPDQVLEGRMEEAQAIRDLRQNAISA